VAVKKTGDRERTKALIIEANMLKVKDDDVISWRSDG
jgi:hypothetical protein